MRSVGPWGSGTACVNGPVEALRALVHAQLAADQLDAAAGYARRVAEMEPFDSDVQRTFIDIC